MLSFTLIVGPSALHLQNLTLVLSKLLLTFLDFFAFLRFPSGLFLVNLWRFLACFDFPDLYDLIPDHSDGAAQQTLSGWDLLSRLQSTHEVIFALLKSLFEISGAPDSDRAIGQNGEEGTIRTGSQTLQPLVISFHKSHFNIIFLIDALED